MRHQPQDLMVKAGTEHYYGAALTQSVGSYQAKGRLLLGESYIKRQLPLSPTLLLLAPGHVSLALDIILLECCRTHSLLSNLQINNLNSL